MHQSRSKYCQVLIFDLLWHLQSSPAAFLYFMLGRYDKFIEYKDIKNDILKPIICNLILYNY